MAALHSAPRKLILSFSFSKRSFILNHYYHYWFIFSFHFFSSTQEATLRPNVKLAIEKLCCAQWSFSVSFLLKIGRILRFALEEQSFAVRDERHFCCELFRWFLVETREHEERGDTSYHPTSRLINLIKFNQICGAFLVFSKFFINFFLRNLSSKSVHNLPNPHNSNSQNFCECAFRYESWEYSKHCARVTNLSFTSAQNSQNFYEWFVLFWTLGLIETLILLHYARVTNLSYTRALHC